MNKLTLYIAAIFGLLVASCGNLEKDITVDLPPFERELNVECYVAPAGTQQPLPFGLPWDIIPPGTPPYYYMILTETVGYYDEFNLPIVEDALVTIEYQGVTDTLDFIPFATSDTDTISLYFGFRTMTENDPNAPFDLHIEDKEGREVSARTFVPAIVPIDTIRWEFNSREEAYISMEFDDPQDQENYYRVVFLKREQSLVGEPGQPAVDSVWTDRLVVAFAFDDEFVEDGGRITVGTDFDYTSGDSVTAFLYQISKEHHDFLETVDAAEQANFSPFAQPTRILTNIDGGMGIFTGYNYEKRFFVIK